MNITPLAIPDVLLIEPRVFGDERGFFYESFNQRAFTQGTGVTLPFVQDNHSKSARGVLRGLHYQVQNPQGKLVRVSETAEFLYKTTDYYAPEHERSIAWNDPTLAIAWPEMGEPPRLSAKDIAAMSFLQTCAA